MFNNYNYLECGANAIRFVELIKNNNTISMNFISPELKEFCSTQTTSNISAPLTQSINVTTPQLNDTGFSESSQVSI